ncbi:alpha/beta hydrolase family protein [Flavihumibacter fluvii]|uniref:alpha/beta hydrolase family protein n=1 Tax=Flavihumibacter fluvii TaxID=2838157 RepID=UPI001BDEF398|nr:prolyl oligopeptidase family serine peptidase [Flavihumibacter fluvii]ULQ54489.1 prolyl oligopeptidase family serine peptidase [Flavihumibacter fluvii]
MKYLLVLFIGLFTGFHCLAQKKALDHSVYDNWQNLGEKLVSADGKYLAFVINRQEGDGELIVRSTDGSFIKQFPRAYQVTITDDSRFLVARIKPFYQEVRLARIKKTAAAEMPGDSLLIMELGKDSVQKIAGIKSYKIPERGMPWLAVHMAKRNGVGQKDQPDSLTRINRMIAEADSLSKLADSIRKKAASAKILGLAALQITAGSKKESNKNEDNLEEGTELVLVNLATGFSKRYTLVSEYLFNKLGTVLILETTPKKGAVQIPATVLWLDLGKQKTDTVMKIFHDAKNYAITEDGSRLAFVAERDSVTKALLKYYKVWMYIPGMDSAKVWLAPFNRNNGQRYIVQPEFNNYFSKDGSRLFIGLSPGQIVKDTSLVDFETARLDLWHYQDDYLQSQQLVQLNNTLKKSWLTYLDTQNGKLVQLGDDSCETVYPSKDGNGRYALGISTKGYRIQQQWTQHAILTLFVIDLEDGRRRIIADKVNGRYAGISPGGRYIFWYDLTKRQWMSYAIKEKKLFVLSKSIPYPLYDEDDDHPDDPPAYGFMGWFENDQFAYVYDRYDVWSCDPLGVKPAISITAGAGRRNRVVMRYQQTDPDEKFIRDKQGILLHLSDEKAKGEGWLVFKIGSPFDFSGAAISALASARFDSPAKARDADVLLYRQQRPSAQNLYLSGFHNAAEYSKAVAVSNLNPQQAMYNWFTVELHHWKMADGKTSEGLLYKPENFDSTKKYPVIFYFYERNADNRYNYIEPMPIRASINIAYYTSNGYLVFDPNIYYKTGQPGEDAYNSVVSAARYLSGFAFVDKLHMGIQGHSWGGYQVAYLVTRTNMFAAAEAGAPVSNMTSAYGGIRWGTGISRQFQYEKSQSRLGATLWEKPELYLKNSPLFSADKIRTPLLLLHNDKDDAVPWYQGIELFSALRRLGKPVWMVSYNDELHGIIERRNRKDWTIRMAQFFDHYLKGNPAPRWMTEGIPAVKKGIDWGLYD